MRLALVFYVFLVRAAVGTLASLLPIWRMRAAERHVRFQALAAFVAFAGAAFLYAPALEAARADLPTGTAAFLSLEGGIPGVLVVLAALCLLVNFAFGTFRRALGRAALAAGVVAGALAIVGTAQLLPTSPGPALVAALAVGGMLGGLLMGSVNNAMVLGHFYLMIRGLPVEALRRAGWFTAAVVLARILWFLGVMLFWEGATDVLWRQEFVWTAWRVAFGMVGPMALLWMVRDTVRLRNTQAATGLLYVAVAFALMGELAAVHLEASTGIPV